MKLSNKILLGFFGFIFIYLTAAFAEVRMKGTPNTINASNSISEMVNISGVAYIKVTGIDKEINVMASDRAELQVLSFSGKMLEKLTYEVSGDTLTLSGLESEENQIMKITLFFPKESLKGITADHSSVNVLGLQSAQLNIVQRSGNISVTDATIANLNVNSSDSSLDIINTEIDSLSTWAQRSQVNIYSIVGFVRGSITDGTLLNITDLQEIQVKKDKSSVLRFNQ